jgi:hypothetical protein
MKNKTIEEQATKKDLSESSQSLVICSRGSLAARPLHTQLDLRASNTRLSTIHTGVSIPVAMYGIVITKRL